MLLTRRAPPSRVEPRSAAPAGAGLHRAGDSPSGRRNIVRIIAPSRYLRAAPGRSRKIAMKRTVLTIVGMWLLLGTLGSPTTVGTSGIPARPPSSSIAPSASTPIRRPTSLRSRRASAPAITTSPIPRRSAINWKTRRRGSSSARRNSSPDRGRGLGATVGGSLNPADRCYWSCSVPTGRTPRPGPRWAWRYGWWRAS